MRFYVLKDGRQTIPNNTEAEYFTLTQQDWDDYGLRTLFVLNYYKNESVCKIGYVKIISKKLEENTKVGNVTNASDYLPEVLDDNEEYYTLGQDWAYYDTLRSKFPGTFRCILEQLHDTAYSPENREKADELKLNYSFLRKANTRNPEGDSETAKIQRELHLRLSVPPVDKEEYYKFKFIYRPGHLSGEIELQFDFGRELEGIKRIYALIGENGIGKTQCLRQMINAFASQDQNTIPRRIPVFGKFILISHNQYDNYLVPDSNVTFNCTDCSPHQFSPKELNEIDNRARIAKKITDNFKEIFLYNKFSIFGEFQYESALNIKYPDFIGEACIWNEQHITETRKKIGDFVQNLSTGELTTLYLYSTLIAEITYDSLIILDEPECNLHPQAITKSISALYKILNKFDSYCILATHSPYVIREILSQNVYVMRKIDSALSFSTVKAETFGANIALLSDEVFLHHNTNTHYKELMKTVLERNNYSYEAACSYFERNNIQLSVGLKLYLSFLSTR